MKTNTNRCCGLFSVGPDHLNVTVNGNESDIRVMDVEVER